MKKHKDIIIVIGIIGIVVAGLVFFSAPGTERSAQTASLIDLSPEKEWTKGNPNAKVTLVEYSDFQCPACGAYYPIIKQLMSEFGDRITFIYRHFPLQQHESANLAARTAEAAGAQGKFWEMHDMIFENQLKWSILPFTAGIIFDGYAKSLGLDVSQFKKDRDSKDVKDRVESDYQSGIKASVNHTPTFFVNQKQILNPRSYDEFKNIIIQALGPQS